MALAPLLVAAACGSDGEPTSPGASGAGAGGAAGDPSGGSPGSVSGHGGTAGAAGAPPHAGRAGDDGDSGAAGSGDESGGTGGESGGTGGESGGTGGESGGTGGDAGASAGESGDAGAAGAAPAELEEIIDHGRVDTFQSLRPDYGGLIVARDGDRLYAVEARRDIEPGPFNLPWRSRFRLAAYDVSGSAESIDAPPVWTFDADPDDVVSDVAVHPSGDVTVAVLRHPPDRMAYDLVRLDRDGSPRKTTTLPAPATIPESDYGDDDPNPLFRMKSDFADVTVGGWVRLLPEAEGLVVVFLSYVDAPSTDPLSTRIATGLARFDWRSNAYAERWARVVEGPHGADPGTWAYDELRWREQAIRPFLAQDPDTGEIVVGRAWNQLRCQANVAVFAEFDNQECVFGAVSSGENERLPLAVTRFSASGERLGTTILRPDEDAAEQVPFALVTSGGKLAVAGSVVRENEDGSKRTYPDPSGYVDYDGYIALYDADGELVLSHDYNLGRGDVFAALGWSAQGMVAVGSSGWDRWQGGMSISRGSDPVVAFLAPDGSRAAARVVPMTNGSRHYNLHDVTVSGSTIIAHGFADAPMTHSADGGNDAARTFGGLRLRLGVD